MFSHERGGFTGADGQHLGFFERAAGGTLFLDEITEMPPAMQVKLLRVLETSRFMRVGAFTRQQADMRVIAATNRPPQAAVASGRLREDLLYRLNVFPIELLPLRDRLSDVPLLANHFLAAFSAQEGRSKRFTPATLAALARHRWPGNVRELRNAVQRAYVMAVGEMIDEQCLPQWRDAVDAVQTVVNAVLGEQELEQRYAAPRQQAACRSTRRAGARASAGVRAMGVAVAARTRCWSLGHPAALLRSDPGDAEAHLPPGPRICDKPRPLPQARLTPPPAPRSMGGNGHDAPFAYKSKGCCPPPHRSAR